MLQRNTITSFDLLTQPKSKPEAPPQQREIIEPMTMRDLLKMIADRQSDRDLQGRWNARSFMRLGVPYWLWAEAYNAGLMTALDGETREIVIVKLTAAGWIELGALSSQQ